MIYKQYLFKQRLPLLNKALDAYALRQKVIAKNIANATSIGYKPQEVKFEELLNAPDIVAKGKITNELHIPIGKKEVNEIELKAEEANVPEPEVYFSGESSVNIDKEMANLAKNQIRFRFASQIVKSYFQGLQSAITGQKLV